LYFLRLRFRMFTYILTYMHILYWKPFLYYIINNLSCANNKKNSSKIRRLEKSKLIFNHCSKDVYFDDTYNLHKWMLVLPLQLRTNLNQGKLSWSSKNDICFHVAWIVSFANMFRLFNVGRIKGIYLFYKLNPL
jgi:hypothetical protein